MFWTFQLDPPPRSASRNGHVALPILAFEPTEEQIRQRAYEIFIARGGDHGSEQADWEQAQRELREQHAADS
ncbi:MAG TPA: DUF2934 domain-containing protein [Candidatus Binataceae bacterium]|nr:DUF2934 domain-containing protein [Candidatus Binataceae bacterium]